MNVRGSESAILKSERTQARRIVTARCLKSSRRTIGILQGEAREALNSCTHMTEVLLNSIEDKIEAQREIEAQEEYKEKYLDLEELIEGYMEQRRDEPASVASFPTERRSLIENDEAGPWSNPGWLLSRSWFFS